MLVGAFTHDCWTLVIVAYGFAVVHDGLAELHFQPCFLHSVSGDFKVKFTHA